MHIQARKFIPPIESLRALAVSLVVLFHLEIDLFKGGFIGVDIFFVISGFLITRNLAEEINAGKFSFYRFYTRRAARLLPALFTATLITLAGAYLILAPADLENLGHSAIYAVLSLSNIFFLLDSGYFDINSQLKPLLHTWSLSVEEQFYLLWPLFVFLTVRRLGHNGLKNTVLIVGGLSLLAALYYANRQPEAVFFLTPFRAYQFALGAIVALLPVPRPGNTQRLVSLASIFFILLLAYFITHSSRYLISAVAPAVCTSTFIWACQSSTNSQSFFTRLTQWIGRRSYSIYLVHWPLIVLWKIATDYSLSIADTGVLLTLTIVGGALLHESVEKKFRFHSGRSSHFKANTLAMTFASMLAICFIGAHYWGMDGLKSRVPQEMQIFSKGLDKEWESRQTALRTGRCNLPPNTFTYKTYDADYCSNPPKGKRSYLIIGDSFASDAYLVFSKAYPDIYFGQLTLPGCLLQLPKRFENQKQAECIHLYQLALDNLVNNPNYTGIILSSNWAHGHYYKIEDFYSFFKTKKLDIYLIGQRIRFHNSLPSILSSSTSMKLGIERANHLIREHEFMVNENIRKKIDGKLNFVDFIKLQCPDQCSIVDSNNQMLYLDDSHLSMAGAQLIASRIKEQFPNIEDLKTLTR
ncbi:hypothetical protein A9179_20170 [Pseudomonas alcaligenes]|uniref:Acyltransferase n=1 Tax=Aquipseudomonas alcaligenes TaxID=43263 RepID=A0ABR7S784_AQUAC|nr:acyltransferase family protein [Pseudomonas alcaligenes]MBC9252587.1 hypothetical protein [Pseudomonas alcaligenes]